MKTLFNKIHYAKNPLSGLFLWPFSLFYGFGVCFRNFLYDKNLLKSTKLTAFVVSVGNLTTGGTGKTPITSAIANYYTRQGKKVAVISRGYGGNLDIKNTNIISDGEKTFYNAEQSGDEPYWIAKNSAGTVVITGKNRIKSGKLAIEQFGAEVLILDDGFQHRKLQRDLDIVLIDAKKGFGNGFLLPAGPLREPVKSIKRASKVIIMNKFPFSDTKSLCSRFEQAIVCELTPEIPDNIATAVAFSGIAQPDSFFNLLERQNIRLISKKVFADHYLYTKKDIQALVADAIAKDVQALLTTEKDMVKIEPFFDEASKENSKIPIYAVKLKVNLNLEKLLEI